MAGILDITFSWDQIFIHDMFMWRKMIIHIRSRLQTSNHEHIAVVLAFVLQQVKVLRQTFIFKWAYTYGQFSPSFQVLKASLMLHKWCFVGDDGVAFRHGRAVSGERRVVS
jgi:hypothetical protein